jgi:hypothetical protein
VGIHKPLVNLQAGSPAHKGPRPGYQLQVRE